MTTARTAVVTGAARGIGAEVARRLAADGHTVALVDIDQEGCGSTVSDINHRGGKAVAVGADISDEQSVATAIEHITSHVGPPTILVNNAGVIRDNLLFRMTVDEWDQVLAVHARGAFLMSRAVQSAMVDAGWGRIVTMSSTAALGNRGQANYSAAKSALMGLTKTLAIELGQFGITANAIAPGFIETDMTRATADRIGIPFADFVARAAEKIPVRRVGKPSDIAAAVAYFVSEEASFVSGQVLYVSGGPTV